MDETRNNSVWFCKIGKLGSLAVPIGGDGPMRVAVERRFFQLTGELPQFCFSGWGGSLTEAELAVVENRLPTPPPPDPRIAELEAEVARTKSEGYNQAIADAAAKIEDDDPAFADLIRALAKP